MVNNFRKYALGEESDLKESLIILKKEFKEKFRKFSENNNENIKVNYI